MTFETMCWLALAIMAACVVFMVWLVFWVTRAPVELCNKKGGGGANAALTGGVLAVPSNGVIGTESPHPMLCFQHGGSEACEAENCKHGFTCPKCSNKCTRDVVDKKGGAG
jgi:hypothetical protein